MAAPFAIWVHWGEGTAGIDDELEVSESGATRSMYVPMFAPAGPVTGVFTTDPTAIFDDLSEAAAGVVQIGPWRPTMASSVMCTARIHAGGREVVTGLPLGPHGAEPTAPAEHHRLSSLLADLAQATTNPEAAIRVTARPFGEFATPAQIVTTLECIGTKPVTLLLDPGCVEVVEAARYTRRWAPDDGSTITVLTRDGERLTSQGEPLTLQPGVSGSFALRGSVDEPGAGATDLLVRLVVELDVTAAGPLAFGQTRRAIVLTPLTAT